MIKYILAALAVLTVVLYAMIWWIGVPSVYQGKVLAAEHPHRYDDPTEPIDSVAIAVFYFVPKDKVATEAPDWRALLERNLAKLAAFQAMQFNGTSAVRYDIYPEPVVGFKDTVGYDTDNTQRGNAQALESVDAEIGARVFDSHGDLYRTSFLNLKPHEYRVTLIMYEGVGASGGGHTAFVSRTYFSDKAYQAFGASTMTHEFLHALGIPDGYDADSVTGAPLYEGIMGIGRERPIEGTFLERNFLEHMGM